MMRKRSQRKKIILCTKTVETERVMAMTSKRVRSGCAERRLISLFLVSCYATLHPALSVRQSVRHTLLFWVFFAVYGPNDQVTSNTVPAHLHATVVAVYPALFSGNGRERRMVIPKIDLRCAFVIRLRFGHEMPPNGQIQSRHRRTLSRSRNCSHIR